MLYAVRQGMLKTVHVNAEGEEQILALNIPGEVLGLEAFGTSTYATTAIALQPVVCCELPLRLFSDEGAREHELDSALVQLLSRAATPKPSQTRGPIRERITGFLRDLGSRFASRGLDGRNFTLGLGRQEIANLLDTRVETVSRMLQRLNREQAIAVRGKQVNLEGLSGTGAFDPRSPCPSPR
jgi:CRP/FNR family transcriptional regulator